MPVLSDAMYGAARILLGDALQFVVLSNKGLSRTRAEQSQDWTKPMAERHIIELLDDLDRAVIVGAGGRHTFSLDEHTWEIDLSESNLKRLRDALQPFIEVGRKRPSGARHVRSVPKGRARSPEETNAIREWARERGFEVSERGRIAEAVIEAYLAENG
ncbi:histone-like nucleoid-structuring protein Lsr2 [Microbacterium phyllosphaerae]|uniref:histone-like nucleoid-structuring protein Lsr2 n=1 Tax=Microbacterium phyllosphaerae TaxID=124798 RepID=UPI002169255A|nr:Lsr2 family protein [Microbacterium phyllosphaerae]MCS3442147.1 hypothetical protein [Microbacterium phyllosphaerae]